MRIAQLVSNYFSVPPVSSKAIYHVVDQVTNGLVDRGHDVTLFASGDSKTKARLVSVTDVATSNLDMDVSMTRRYQHLLSSKCYEMADQFDIIHSHFNVVSSYYSNLVGTPTVQTLHSPITDETRPILNAYKDHRYISFSFSQRRMMPELNWIGNVYHGIDTSRFPFNETPEDYLLFIGRITEDKGAHLAIEAARAAGMPLVIAGKSHGHEPYWHKEIEPHIDGKMVRYIGEASHEDKVEYFRNAKALLFPIQWEEPFGLVMIEAMACGTPVIGFNRGSVDEIVQHKETGFVVHDVKGMVDTIGQLQNISRQACRERVDMFFTYDKMVTGYDRLYERVHEEHQRENLR